MGRNESIQVIITSICLPGKWGRGGQGQSNHFSPAHQLHLVWGQLHHRTWNQNNRASGVSKLTEPQTWELPRGSQANQYHGGSNTRDVFSVREGVAKPELVPVPFWLNKEWVCGQ